MVGTVLVLYLYDDLRFQYLVISICTNSHVTEHFFCLKSPWKLMPLLCFSNFENIKLHVIEINNTKHIILFMN